MLIISMHIPSFVKIHWNFLVIVRKRKYSNPKTDLHNIDVNINAYIKFGKHLLNFTRYRPETKLNTCPGQITLSKIDEICPFAIQARSPQYQCTYQVWWIFISIHSSYHPETKMRTDCDSHFSFLGCFGKAASCLWHFLNIFTYFVNLHDVLYCYIRSLAF